MFKELYPSDITQLGFERSKQWLPFFKTTKIAVAELSHSIVKLEDEVYFYGCYHKNKLIKLVHLSIEMDKMFIHNVIELLASEDDTNSHFYLHHLAKKHRVDKLVLCLDKQSDNINARLIKKGYVYNDHQGFIFDVNYNTGLVLGGGGAKGAYQIGVWHALKELGIEYQMISGTSVGALNGGLILQGDIGQAEKMWQKISTDQILSVSGSSAEQDYSINQVVKEMQELTTLAIQSKGVSTEPLLQLIKELMIPEKVVSQEAKFFIVTTATPLMEERVVSLSDMTEETFPLWLLASSSFFPAMAACLIDGTYYVDGGYRNNIPKDVLIKEGASELIVVDVDGPGITKLVKVPREINELTLKSPWSLGNVLLFDGNRSSWNMSLGYLETMKIFSRYRGDRYTLEKENYKKTALQLSRQFFAFLSEIDEFEEWYQKKTKLKKWTFLQRNNHVPETISIKLLENLSMKFNIEPAQVYSIEELISEVKLKVSTNGVSSREVGMAQMKKSIGELLSQYVKVKTPLTEYQLMMAYYRYFKKEKGQNREFFELVMDVSWMTGLEALFLIFLEKRT